MKKKNTFSNKAVSINDDLNLHGTVWSRREARRPLCSSCFSGIDSEALPEEASPQAGLTAARPPAMNRGQRRAWVVAEGSPRPLASSEKGSSDVAPNKRQAEALGGCTSFLVGPTVQPPAEVATQKRRAWLNYCRLLTWAQEGPLCTLKTCTKHMLYFHGS